ncbi:alkaline phosphatase family protein [Halosolutus halophilus]|uniref:alkaline phosphatase family protein n=1 Tax=Halosolutus halophilus TaxID=1552990 RepID=UPI002234ED49|nr:alkaline phosphatase family protein [Halosolutus halophilus]
MSGTEPPTAADRAFVLGIDGVPWDRLQTWIEAGELPNFGTLVDEGVGSPLRSTTPPTTPLAWPSIATGVWPDKHGIYGFQRLESDYTQRMYTGDDRTQPALWDLLSPAIVGNVPMTFPASEIDGSMVSGMLSPRVDERSTHPATLADEIDAHVPEYEIGLNWQRYSGAETAFRNDLAALVDARRTLMNRLMKTEEWRLFFFVYTAPDRLQHLIWDDEVMLEHYKHLDDILGDVIEYTDRRDANLFVVSDHGFGPISTFVNLNTILSNNGHLSRRRRTAAQHSLERLGITKSALLETIKTLGIDNGRVVNALPKSLVDRVATNVPGDHGLYDVDFSETVAFAHGPGHVYINDSDRFDRGIVAPADVPSVRRELRSLFSTVTDPETGERVLTVSDGDDLFPTDESSPDLVVLGRDGYEEKTKLAADVFTAAGAKAAGHRSRGVFFARGPGIATSDSATELSVVDVAPTLLHSIGEPVPEAVDGTVRTDRLAVDASPTTRSLADRDGDDGDDVADDDFDDVEERLRGLGYMG